MEDRKHLEKYRPNLAWYSAMDWKSCIISIYHSGDVFLEHGVYRLIWNIYVILMLLLEAVVVVIVW